MGFYKVTVTATGFPPYSVDKVEVLAGTIYSLPIKLSMQQQSTTVEVSAATLTLDTTTQTQNTTISTQMVQDLPLNGRDFTQMIALAPGYSGYSVGGYGSLNGTRPNQMNWQIDGVDNNDFWHNIPAVNQGGVSGIAGVVMPVDAVDEFSAQTQSGAEAGRNAGGTVNLVLKSGANQLHGSAYFYWRNEVFSDPSPFFCSGLNPACPSTNPTKSPRLRNENYGFTVGGPIIKNKFFFFLAFEKQQYIIGLSGCGHGTFQGVRGQCSGFAHRPTELRRARFRKICLEHCARVARTQAQCRGFGQLPDLLPSWTCRQRRATFSVPRRRRATATMASSSWITTSTTSTICRRACFRGKAAKPLHWEPVQRWR